MNEVDPAVIGRDIIDAGLYLVLGTADADGRPWVSPVYFAFHAYREFFWVSDPDARHSANIAERPEVSLVVFDSRQEIGTGRGVYVEAVADLLDGDERMVGLSVFSNRSQAHGGRPWTADMVEAPARHRLYRATALRQYVVDGADRRIGVELWAVRSPT